MLTAARRHEMARCWIPLSNCSTRYCPRHLTKLDSSIEVGQHHAKEVSLETLWLASNDGLYFYTNPRNSSNSNLLHLGHLGAHNGASISVMGFPFQSCP